MRLLETALEKPICRLAYDFVQLASHRHSCAHARAKRESIVAETDVRCDCGYSDTFVLAMKVLKDHSEKKEAS